MLFNSHVFIFLFLPITLIGFYLIRPRQAAMIWLALASLFFYGWWNPIYVTLIVVSTGINFLFGRALEQETPGTPRAQRLLAVGLLGNLTLLCYFKYANFLVDNLAWLCDAGWQMGKIVLPLGISFFTFQKIAYLVDAYRGETRRYGLVPFALFVTFFPQLIAGPIVHHREVVPQFDSFSSGRFRWDNLAVGATIFLFGLFKKVVLADTIAAYAAPLFQTASRGVDPSFCVAWQGALSYACQLYFDFSGYSDMAIGLARMFGIRLPVNFNSPYQAVDIIGFWRSWHMTLSRFLRDYLYIPLGGNRRGAGRRWLNLMLTMLLGGLWHGAGWTFVLWGAMHGLYLTINHAWRGVTRGLAWRWTAHPGWHLTARGITFAAVVVAWVPFRAEEMGSAWRIWLGMAGQNGLGEWGRGWPELVVLLALAWFAPNTQRIMARYRPVLVMEGEWAKGPRHFWQWRPTPLWGMAAAGIAAVATLSLTKVSEFLYFQF